MTGVAAGADSEEPIDAVVLQLAQDLARGTSLRDATVTALPVVAAVAGAPVAVFAVAGSSASGARVWPRGEDWSAAFADRLAGLWESGPLTEYCREVGVVPPFRLADAVRELGWELEPLRLPVGGREIRYVTYLAVAVRGRTVCGYFAGRTDREVDDVELARLARVQSVVVASHGRFLAGPGEAAPLTARQQQILQLLGQGLTTGAIASRLQISDSTVGKHLRDLYARLDTHDRVSTLREAQAHGLLDGVVGEAWQDVRLP